jgi:hypothetical protein
MDVILITLLAIAAAGGYGVGRTTSQPHAPQEQAVATKEVAQPTAPSFLMNGFNLFAKNEKGLEPMSLQEAQNTREALWQTLQENVSDEEYKKYKDTLLSVVDASKDALAEVLETILILSTKHSDDAKLAFDETSIALLEKPETRGASIAAALDKRLVRGKSGMLPFSYTDTALSADFRVQIMQRSFVRFGQKILAMVEEKFPGDANMHKLLDSFVVTLAADPKFDQLFSDLYAALKKTEIQS